MKKIYLLTLGLMGSLFSANAQWAVQQANLPAARAIRKLDVVDANTVWGVAADTVSSRQTPIQEVIVTTDGGTTWTPRNVGDSIQWKVNSISAVSATTAWVAMNDEFNGGGKIRKTTDGGQTWTDQPTAAFAAPDGWATIVHFYNANDGVAIGDPNGGYFEIYTTSNGGTTWTRVPQANIPDPLSNLEFSTTLYSAVGNHIWWGTYDGRIMRSTDKGLTWTVAPSSLFIAQNIAFSDTLNGLANLANMVAKTTDGGLTWSRLTTSGPFHSYGLAAVPGTNGYYVSTGFSGVNKGSSYSTDYGTTWTNIDTLAHTAVAFHSPFSGWSGSVTDPVTAQGGMYGWTGNFGFIGRGETAAEAGLLAYPNPSKGTFRVRLSGQARQLRVTDALGRLVFTQSSLPQTQELAIDLRNQPKGLYLLEVTNGSQVQRQKLVLE